jgi:hypothetical protein
MAAATSPVPRPEPPAAPQLRLAAPAPEAEAAQLAVERRMLRAALVGMAVGALVCIVLWDLVVLVALAGSGEPLGPPLLMGVVVGVFAGVFFGGWAGMLYGAHLLEEHERHARPAPPKREPAG